MPPVLKHTSSVTETSQVNPDSNTSGPYPVDQNIIQYKGKYLVLEKKAKDDCKKLQNCLHIHILIRIY